MAILFFLLGAICASFVGVVAGRLNTGQGFLTGRSRCDVCDEPLSPLVLIPILSYLVTSGESACCRAPISTVSPLTEVVLGALFVLSFHTLGLSLVLLLFLISLALLLALVLYDFAHQILPPVLLGLFTVTAALTGFLSSASIKDFGTSVLVALILGGSLALIHVFSGGRAMGLSDAPLAFALALLTGSLAVSGFIFSFWIGAVIGIALLARRPRGSRMGIEVPFAPFLAAGFLLAYFTQWNVFAIAAAFH